jgi:endonuclease YncB( thermonuclease family)
MELVLVFLFVGIVVLVARSGSPRRVQRRDVTPESLESRFPGFRIPQTPGASGPPSQIVTTLTGSCWVEDGDTIYMGPCAIRLAGIDAPELDQPYGAKAKFALVALCKGQKVTAVFSGEQSYTREVATCFLEDGRDLSAEMVKLGLALDWRKFSGGKYRHLEPQDARRKLWRVEAKHRGRYSAPAPKSVS